MTYNLEEFCEDCREAISEKGDTFNIETVVKNLEKFLKNQNFVEETCGPDAETGTHVLYQDPEKG